MHLSLSFIVAIAGCSAFSSVPVISWEIFMLIFFSIRAHALSLFKVRLLLGLNEFPFEFDR